MIKPKCYAINRKKDHAEILIYGVIGIDWWTGGGNTAEGFAEEFSALEKEFDTILVRINSPGGDIMEGLPIYNILAQSQKEVNTRIDGVAASMGAIIALAGKKVSAPKSSIFMLHRAATCMCGNANDFREAADQLEVWEGSLIPAIAKKTGLTEDEVKAKWFDGKDHFMTGQQAFDEGLIDELIDGEPDIPAAASKTENLSYQEIVAAYQKVRPNTSILQTFKRTINSALGLDNNNTNQHTKTDNTMLKVLCALLALSMTATEDEVIGAVREMNDKKRKSDEDLAAERTLRETAENALTDLNAQITAKDTEITTLKAELAKAPADRATIIDSNDKTIKDDKNKVVLDEINEYAKKF